MPRAGAAVAAAGADGLSLVNTLRGLALDERTLQPRLALAAGGYSGPALKPVALAAVFAAYRATGLPIVGMGGVATGRDALELIAAGATHVALGTVLFADPDAPPGSARSWPPRPPRTGSRTAVDAHAPRTARSAGCRAESFGLAVEILTGCAPAQAR